MTARLREKPERPNLDTVKEFWEAHINNEYYTGETRGTKAYFDEIARRRYKHHYHLVELFESLTGSSGTLLEIGCGIGVDSIELSRCGFDVTAVDLTETAIEIAREHARVREAKVDFRIGNAEGLGFDDEAFDAVYSFGVLHHTPDIVAAVADLHRVLKPGGHAYVMLYHQRSLVDLIHRVFRLPYESPRDLKDHCPVVDRFTPATVRELFADFDALKIHTDYPFTYGFRYLTFWMPVPLLRWLGRAFGWHVMIHATKHS